MSKVGTVTVDKTWAIFVWFLDCRFVMTSREHGFEWASRHATERVTRGCEFTSTYVECDFARKRIALVFGIGDGVFFDFLTPWSYNRNDAVDLALGAWSVVSWHDFSYSLIFRVANDCLTILMLRLTARQTMSFAAARSRFALSLWWVLDLGVLQGSLKRNAQLFGGFHASRTGGNFRRSDHQPLTLLALENHPRRRINHPPKTGTSLHLHVIDSSAHSIISPRASQTISTSQPKRGPFITATHVVLNIDFYTVMNDIFLADKKSSIFCNVSYSLDG